jgi:hypothetical protein
MIYPRQLGNIGLFLRTLRLGLDPWWLPLEGVRNPRGENLDLLLHTHFSDSGAVEERVAPVFTGRATRLDWQVAAKVVTYRTVVWAIDSFALYKSPGKDGIFPALLQEGREVLVPYLVRIFRTCLATGYVPTIWHLVKVVFIPKPGRDSYGGPKIIDLSALHHSCLRPWKD